MTNLAFLPGSPVSSMVPLWASMALATIASPRPTPSGRILKNGLKDLFFLLLVNARTIVVHGKPYHGYPIFLDGLRTD